MIHRSHADRQQGPFFEVQGRQQVLFRVDGDLQFDGDLTLGGGGGSATARIEVGRDLRLNGSIDTQGQMGDEIVVGRNAQIAPGATLPAEWPITVQGELRREEVPLDPICSCGGGGSGERVASVDVAGIVAEAFSRTDIPLLDPGIFRTGGSLPAGRFRIAQSAIIAAPITVTGATALYVQGNLQIQSAIDVRPGATLDVFVSAGGGEMSSGGVSIETTDEVGSLRNPSKVRIYVEGGASFIGGARLGANLFTRTQVFLGVDSGVRTVYGALVGASVTLNGKPLELHYDRAVLREGETCDNLPSVCLDDCDCDGGARCVSGVCLTTCSSDDDCTTPLVCNTTRGQCESLLI